MTTLPEFGDIDAIAASVHRTLSEQARSRRQQPYEFSPRRWAYHVDATLPRLIRAACREQLGRQPDYATVVTVQSYLHLTETVTEIAELDQGMKRLRVAMMHAPSQRAYRTVVDRVSRFGQKNWFESRLTHRDTGQMTVEEQPVTTQSLVHQCSECALFFRDEQELSTHRCSGVTISGDDEETAMPEQQELNVNEQMRSTETFELAQELGLSQPLNEQRFLLIRALGSQPDSKISDPRGFTHSEMLKIEPLLSVFSARGGALASLEEDGFVTREIAAKRTYSVQLTEKGQRVYDNLEQVSTYASRVLAMLERGGGVMTASSQSGSLPRDLSREMGAPADRIYRALDILERRGLVVAERFAPSNRYKKITLVTHTDQRAPARATEQQPVEGVAPSETTSRPAKKSTAATPSQGERSTGDLESVVADLIARLEEFRQSRTAPVEEIRKVLGRLHAGEVSPLTALAEIESHVGQQEGVRSGRTVTISEKNSESSA